MTTQEDHRSDAESVRAADMGAMVHRGDGPPEVVSLARVLKPTPAAREVLIRIRATTVTTADWGARSHVLPAGFGLLGRLVFGVFGPRKPVLGTELAGDVEAVGAAVTRFKVGDSVFAFTGGGYGGHADYRTMREDGLIALKPSSLSYQEAAALSFGGTTALEFLGGKAGIRAGDKVLIVGASGGVGTAAVRIAKHFQAEVTGVCSTANLQLVLSIGADHVVDYTKEDFTKNGETYDIILDTTATTSLGRCGNSLKPGGRLLLVLASFARSLGLDRPKKASRKKVVAGVSQASVDDLRLFASLAETPEFKPVIDRTHPLTSAVQAHAYVDTGRKKGYVVLEVHPEVRVIATELPFPSPDGITTPGPETTMPAKTQKGGRRNQKAKN